MRPTKAVIRRIALAALLVCPAPAAARAEEIDRLLAAVNSRVITRLDLTLAANLNAVMVLGRTVASGAPERELDRLIDLEILSQELSNSADVRPNPERVDAAMRDLENAYAEIGGLTGLLTRLGLERAELAAYVALQLAVTNFIESRFRRFASVSPEEQQAYYRAKLVPDLERAGAAVPPLEAVAADITRLLTEQKADAALESWLRDVRRHSRIELFTGPAFPGEVTP